MPPKARRKYSGFCVETREGRYLKQYQTPSLEETRALYHRHNPQLDGHPDGHRIVRYTLVTELLE